MTADEYFGDWSKVISVSQAEGLARRLAPLGRQLCPLVGNVFKAFSLCSYHSLKVVILGQDPYPDIRQGCPTATGIAFANAPGTLPCSFSPSLGVLMESVIDFSLPHTPINFDPSLEKWESQGVLMLNSALSCLVGKPGSHTLLWRPFMRSFLTSLSACSSGIVYVLMGAQAQSFEPFINARSNHIVKVRHPSWYARNSSKLPHSLWLHVNSILKGIYGSGIQWYEEY